MSAPSSEASPPDKSEVGERSAPDAHAGDGEEFARLEGLLAERAHALEAERTESSRLRTLLREALGQFTEVTAVGIRAPAQEAEASVRVATHGDTALVAARDAAIGRALEAEAARAEIALRLDEAMGFLAEARSGDDDGLDLARESGTARGLRSALAEMEEARELLGARLVLVEHDLEAAGERATDLERELAEAREHLELKHVQVHGLRKSLEAASDPSALEGLKGEMAGTRARCEEAERALSSATPELEQLREALTESRRQLGTARAQLGAASSGQAGSHERIEELERLLAHEGEGRRELEKELSSVRAEQLVARDELSRARGEVESLSRDLAEAEDGRGRREETLEAQRDAAQRGTAEQRRRVERLREALREVRDTLDAIGASVRDSAREGKERTSDPGEPTQPGMPVHIEAIEALEGRVAARDDRIRQLETQLAEAVDERAAAVEDHAGAINKVREKAAQLAADLESNSRRVKAFEEVSRALQSSASEGPLERDQLDALFAVLDS